jgi:hypothetical protein
VPRRGLVAAIAVAVLIGTAGVAVATTSITTPSTSPFAIPGDVSATVGNPVAIDVVATGFNNDQNVFVEQCDGMDPAAQGWSVTNDCDFGEAPGPTSAVSPDPSNPTGTAVASFTGDGNNFQAFKNGKLEAQNKFNCIGPDDPPINNGKMNWTTCKIRVSSNNTAATGDQAFLDITLPDYPSSVTSTTSTSTSSTSTSSTSSTSTSTTSTTVHQVPTCGLGAGVPVTGKPNKNIGTVKLSPGVTTTASTKALTIKLSGTMDNCANMGTRPNQKLPISAGSFTASIQVPVGAMCPSTFVTGAPIKAKLTLKWLGLKSGKLSGAAASDTFKLLGSFTQSGNSPLSFTLMTGPFTGTKSSFAGNSATMTFVIDQNQAAINTACGVKGGLKLLNFTGVQGPSQIVFAS